MPFILRLILLLLLLVVMGCSDRLSVLDGDDLSLGVKDSRWLVINYWATWCAPCHREIPELNALHLDSSDEILVLGVYFDSLPDNELRSLVYDAGILYPSLRESPHKLLQYPMPSVLPTTVILQRSMGKQIVLKGEQTKEAILAAIGEE